MSIIFVKSGLKPRCQNPSQSSVAGWTQLLIYGEGNSHHSAGIHPAVSVFMGGAQRHPKEEGASTSEYVQYVYYIVIVYCSWRGLQEGFWLRVRENP